jgi:hypothetical protein
MRERVQSAPQTLSGEDLHVYLLLGGQSRRGWIRLMPVAKRIDFDARLVLGGLPRSDWILVASCDRLTRRRAGGVGGYVSKSLDSPHAGWNEDKLAGRRTPGLSLSSSGLSDRDHPVALSLRRALGTPWYNWTLLDMKVI